MMAQKKVLIVEDDVIISSFIQIKLEEMGYAVPAKARTGKQAVELAQKYKPDLILMDVMLEGEIDGIQAVEEITKYLDIPIIYLTASSDEKTVERLMKTEPHGFLIKPFDDRILFSAIHIAVYRHRTKKELFDTKEMLRTTFESIDNLVFSLDAQGVFTHNHSGEGHKLELFKEENIIGKSISQVFPLHAAKKLNESITWIIDYKSSRTIEFSLDQKGVTYWFDCKLTLRKDEKGNILSVTMVLSDISDYKNMYRELVVSQDKLTEAQQIARLGSCDIFFKEKRFVYNDLFFDILDVEDKQAFMNSTDEQLLDIIHPDDRARIKTIFKQIIDNKIVDFSADFRIKDQKGQERFIHSAGQVKHDVDHLPQRLIITIQDISLQKTSEKLRRDVELSHKTAEMKQRFFARLSHEIRNPVSGITGLLHLLERTELDDRQNDFIQALKTSSDTLLTLLNDVLDYSRIESGMMKINPNHFNLRTTLKNIYTFYIPQALEKQIDFTYMVADDLPDKMLADENKIVQVISNLLSNAFKFIESGSIGLSVICLHRENDEVKIKIEVADTGPGINPKDQGQLFEDFIQLDNGASGNSRGTGLGLSICKQLVELMGGQIGLESEGKNQGTKFWFVLPVITAEEEKKAEGNKFGKPFQPEEKLNCSVLLVDDMLVNQKVIKLILNDFGCKVAVAANGKQAVEMFKESDVNAFDIFAKVHYDIILMDHFMPIMDGQTALEVLNTEFKSRPPVIVLTADESFAQNNKFKEVGFDDYIIKPVRAAELYAKIKKHIDIYAQKAPGKKSDSLDIDDISQKPVMNENTLNLIIKNARENKFDVAILFESFIEDMDRIYDQSLSAVEMNDYNSLKLIVMSVKGLSGNFGASQVHAVARLMDRYMRNDQFDEAIQLFPLLTEKYSIFKSKIENEYLDMAGKI